VNVRTKLRGAFAVYIALLAGLSLYHVRTTRRAVATAKEISDIASRLVASTEMVGQLSEIGANAQKAVVSGDSAYAVKTQLSIDGFDSELHSITSMKLSAREQSLITPLVDDWNRASAVARDIPLKPGNAKRDSAYRAQLAEALDFVHERTQQLARASDEAMNTQQTISAETEREAEHATLLAALGAVLLSIVMSALLARSILKPLNLFAEGTREVTAGRFNHRLTPTGSDELARVARDFNVMTERLDELDRMKRDFVSKVSHDLKTPLSSMQETTAVMLDEVPGPLTAKQRQLLLINQESGQRLSGMLTKLLDLSRIEAGLDTEQRVVDPRQIVQRAVDHLVQGSSAERVSLTMSDAEPKELVRGDPDALSQVFDNLLDNALKFSPFDGTVAVTVADLSSRGDVPPDLWAALRRHGLNSNAVLVTVADEGPGIPDDDKERVFERFYQTDAGRAARSRGVGLGLAICREIVTTHGGVIWVSDNDPRGSIFHVLLPGASGSERPAPRPLHATGNMKRR
jgi:two-component system sensor histidine kinase GlrK